jgi:hypothetical protein
LPFVPIVTRGPVPRGLLRSAVRYEKFSEQLEKAINRYRTRALTSAQIIESLELGVTIDWDRRTDVQAGIRAKVKRQLRLHGYPAERSEQAIDQLLRQTDVFARSWSA